MEEEVEEEGVRCEMSDDEWDDETTSRRVES